MGKKKGIPAQQLHEALQGLEPKNEFDEVDLLSLFNNNRELLSDLATANLSESDALEYPILAKYSTVAKETLEIAGRSINEHDQRVDASKSLVKERRLGMKLGETVSNKYLQAPGVVGKVSVAERRMPEITKSYKGVLTELSTSEKTFDELKTTTGIPKKQLVKILKDGETKGIIRSHLSDSSSPTKYTLG